MNENIVYKVRETPKRTPYSHSDLVMDWFEYFHWASNRQVQIMERGFATKRHFPTEEVLKKLAMRGSLRVAKYGQIKVYAEPRKTKGDLEDHWKIYHGLGCTETLIRFYKSGLDVQEIIPEKSFRGFGCVPEWGLLYPRTLLLGEFSTKSDVIDHGNIPGKLRAYDRYLERIEEEYEAKAIVVFILDIPRDQVLRRVRAWQVDGPYYFCDYETFLKVPIGQQLTAPIYFYTDGKEYSLA